MSTVEITEKLLLNAGGWEALKPARDLHKSGRVVEAEYNPPLLTGLVREGSRNYRAGLRVKSAEDVENLCTCRESRAWGRICGHSVAVGLAHLSPAPAQEQPAKTETASVPPAAVSQMPRFLSAESDVATAVALHFILPPTFAGAWEKRQVMVVIEAEFEGRRTMLSALASNRGYACDAHDLTALAELDGFPAAFTSGMLMLSRDEFLRFLPALRNHPRVSFGKSNRVSVSSATYRPELSLQQTGRSRLSAAVHLPQEATLLANATDAWLLRKHEFIRCGGELPVAAVKLMEQPLILEADRMLQFLAIDLPLLRGVFDLRADDAFPAPEVAAAIPRFALSLQGSLNQLSADLLCSYGDRPPIRATKDEANVFVFRDPQNADRILIRNLPAEQAAIARIEEFGFTRTSDRKAFELLGQGRVVRFFAVGYPVVQREWNVTLAPQVQKWSSEIERVTPKMEVVSAGEDWFELRYSLSTSGGQEFSSAEIQRLLRSGQTQTRLRNGRLAIFDSETLDDFEQVIRDCDPAQRQPGLYRINRAHAAYVEATARDSGSTLVDFRRSLQGFVAEVEAATDFKGKLGCLSNTLREYQIEGVKWLTRLAANRLGGILADEMGLGKTVQALAFFLAGKGAGPALIVCPTSLVANWESEARRFTPQLKTLVLEGADRQPRYRKVMSSDIVIMSYALLRRDIDDLRKFEFSAAVLDEAQHIKNPDTQNAQAAYSLRAAHKFVLTGTPMENSVRDLWSIMNFVAPGYLGTRTDFRERYEQPLARGPAPDVQRRLSRRLRPFLLRRRKRDVAKDLPEKIEQVVPSDLTSIQRAAYDALLCEIQQGLGTADKNPGAVRMKMLTGLLRLRQVCCDLRLTGLGEQNPENSSAKLDLLSELLAEAIDGEHRVLVFSQFVSMLHLVRERLEKLEIAFCYLDGQTKERQSVVNRFQTDADIPVFLISLKAGGVGLNLSAADTVIHFDPWWNPAVEAQATDRAHRIGQTRVVTAYKLISRNTVEEKILHLQDKKRAAIDAAIESEEPMMSGLTTGELEALLS